MSEQNAKAASTAAEFRSPPQKAGAALIVTYVIAYLGIWMAALTPIIVSLPIRVRQIDPQNYLADLSGILAAGALLAMVANPFFGRMSDRTTSRFGMRRPWLIVGAAAGLVGVLIIALVPSIAAVAVGWCLAQVAVNILLAVTTAILPDQIPSHQRGKVSGYLSMCMSIAPVAGAFIVEHFLASPLWMFLTPALIMAVGSLLLAAVLKDRHMPPEDVPPYGLHEFLNTFWINWLKHTDFTWIWLSRFLRFISLALLLGYQVYFITDHLGMSTLDVSHIMVISTLVSAVMGVIGANAAGFFSDRSGRRKIFVIAGALIYAGGLFAIAFSQSLAAFYVAIGICGFGQGIFIALDFAIVSEVLPEAKKDAAKDFGVFNIANALPQSIAPAFAPFVLAIGAGKNFTALFVVAGLTSLLGAGLITLIRKVR